MTRIHALILLFLILFVHASFSQQKKTVEKKGGYLRTNIFSILEIDGGVMLGTRYQWNKHFSATVDPTFIFFNPYHKTFDDISNPRGIKIRADVRFHFSESFLEGKAFIAPEFHYKYRSKDRLATFGFNCVNNSCAYYMETTYKEQKKEIGASLKAGVDLPRDNNERLSFEIYGGLGVKIFRYKEEDVPIGGSFLGEPSHQDFFGSFEGSASPMLFGSIKVSYRLR